MLAWPFLGLISHATDFLIAMQIALSHTYKEQMVTSTE